MCTVRSAKNPVMTPRSAAAAAGGLSAMVAPSKPPNEIASANPGSDPRCRVTTFCSPNIVVARAKPMAIIAPPPTVASRCHDGDKVAMSVAKVAKRDASDRDVPWILKSRRTKLNKSHDAAASMSTEPSAARNVRGPSGNKLNVCVMIVEAPPAAPTASRPKSRSAGKSSRHCAPPAARVSANPAGNATAKSRSARSCQASSLSSADPGSVTAPHCQVAMDRAKFPALPLHPGRCFPVPYDLQFFSTRSVDAPS